MEDNTHFAETSQPMLRGDPAQMRNESADLAPNEHSNAAEEEDMSTQHVEKELKDSTVTFKNHHGERYIWPFEHCRSYDSIKPLLKEVYTLLQDQELVEEVEKGNYEIQTDDDATILPTLWTSIVKPDSTIKIHFLARRPTSSGYAQDRPDYSRRSEMRFISRDAREDDEDEFVVGMDASRPSSPSPRDLANEISERDSDTESQMTTESEAESLKQPVIPEPPRDVVPPTDTEGNKLSFKVNTAYARAWQQHQSEGSGRIVEKPSSQETIRNGSSENLKITKVMTTKDEGRNMLQIYTLSGPDDIATKDMIGIRWYHLYSEQLSFSHFTETCLAVPGLSERLKMLIKRTLGKIEKENLRMALEGMFIEPGTVLRGDEDGQPDPQSVIFCCVPYFDLQPAPKKTSNGQAARLCPSKTLIQTYYPYEPVRERDAEQAYRKFGDEHSNRLIHVPNLWIMNIGSHTVVTCGHQPLAKELIKSIEVVSEDPQQLGMQATAESTATNIRLTDWDGRVLLFSTEECKTYFQMEQRLREVMYLSRRRIYKRDLGLRWTTTAGEMKVTPLIWNEITKQSKSTFVNLAVADEKKSKELGSEHNEMSLPELLASSTSSSLVPPFFHWPQATSDNEEANQSPESQDLVPPDVKRAIACLERVENAMLSEILSSRDTRDAVDVTFTSTSFYKRLPENTFENIETNMTSLLRLNETKTEPGNSKLTHHQFVIHTQCTKIVAKTSEFFQIVNATLKLFIRDVDKTTILRKVWGAMAGIHDICAKICQRGDLGADPAEYSDPNWNHAELTDRYWFIRPFSDDPFIPDPEADEKFKRSVRRCRRCRHFERYSTPQAALKHLRKHLKSTAEPKQEEGLTKADPASNLPVGRVAHLSTDISDDRRIHLSTQTARDVPVKSPTYSAPKTAPSQSTSSIVDTTDQNLKDRIVNFAQFRREDTNAASLAILAQAYETARDLFVQARELAEGVKNEDGTMSELYHLPDQLLKAFHSIVVFYLATERALFYADDNFLNNGAQSSRRQELYDPEQGLNALRRFGGSARLSLAIARNELCRMVMSKPPKDVFTRLSLSPEYLCSWLMRRLFVKPLEKSMTVADMYREYLSTIQFQVNHRPGKRLLRSINLLKEELLILTQVNTWQTKAITSYMRVLDDTTYENDIPLRRGMFPYERMLLRSCKESLVLTQEEYADQISRCGPLSDTTKQSLEINEEDHGKAIMVFTITTLIFLPLSFVTSYLGMNSSDLRDMESGQSLFWIIAIPLTVLTISSILYIGYNGDDLRDFGSSVYRTLTGKQDHRTSARGISVAQRKGVHRIQDDSNSSLDHKSYADEAEFASPLPEYDSEEYLRAKLAYLPRQEFRLKALRMDDPATGPRHSVYPRLNRSHIDPEGLKSYSIPFEDDPKNLFSSGNTRRRPRLKYYDDEWAAPTPRVQIDDALAMAGEDEVRGDEYTWHKKGRHGTVPRSARNRYVRRETRRSREPLAKDEDGYW